MTDDQPTSAAPILAVEVYRDGWTNGIQVSIQHYDQDGGGTGYRLVGPKFNGSSERLARHRLSRLDANEIRRLLDCHFPPEETP